MSERVESHQNLAYLSLGSNIRPEQHLLGAVRMLSRQGCLRAVSRVWESPPVDGSDQPNYLNAAVLLRTSRSAEELCTDVIPGLERQLDRVRVAGDKYAPRTIDIDLSLFNTDVLHVGHRKIPDPDISERLFVIAPLAELDPGYVHPESGKTLAKICSLLTRSSQALSLRQDITDSLQRLLVESKDVP